MKGAGSEIPAGRSYLFTEKGVHAAYAILKYLLIRGQRGLIISQTHPQKIPMLYDVHCPAIWIADKLSSKGSVMTVEPQQIARIYSLIGESVRNNPGSVVLLDGLEYLIEENDFSSVMKALQLINEAIAMTESIFLLPVNPRSLSPQEMGFLEREISPFEFDPVALKLLSDKSF